VGKENKKWLTSGRVGWKRGSKRRRLQKNSQRREEKDTIPVTDIQYGKLRNGLGGGKKADKKKKSGFVCDEGGKGEFKEKGREQIGGRLTN